MRGVCAACKTPLEAPVVRHHVSYDPEKTVQVHKRCHMEIHHTDKHPELRPCDHRCAWNFRLHRRMAQLVDEIVRKWYNSRGEFVREAVREKLERMGVKLSTD